MKKFSEEEMKHIADVVATRYIASVTASSGEYLAEKYVSFYDQALKELEKINQSRD